MAVFPLALIAGTWVGQGFVPLDFVDPATLAAMSALGLLLVAGRRLPLRAMATAAVGVGVQFIPGVGFTGVGLLFLKGCQLFRDAPGAAAASRYIPAVSALVILILGLGITVEAVWRLASL